MCIEPFLACSRVFTVAEMLSGGDMFTHIERAYSSKPYSEEEVNDTPHTVVMFSHITTQMEVRKTFSWLVLGTKFLHEVLIRGEG